MQLCATKQGKLNRYCAACQFVIFFLSIVMFAVAALGQTNRVAAPPVGSLPWVQLELPAEGKTGFTRLTPEQTGVQFTNVLDEWSSASNRVLENGSGVAIGDYDQDGWPDIFLCSLKGRSVLYHNLGGWQFEDVTAQAGIPATNYVCRGAVFADINGDQWPDLLITTLGRGVLCFLNDRQGHLKDFTSEAGTATSFGSSTLTLADIDGNGTLDLYVANYRSEDIRDSSLVEARPVNGQMTLHPRYQNRLLLTPQGLREFGEPDVLYLNNGQGRFRPVSWTGGAFQDESGRTLAQAPMDWGLSAAFRDLNGDGWPDLYVCNDYWTPDRLWMNDGRGHFRAAPRLALRHTSENSMGVDFADIDRDGNVDMLVADMLSRDSRLRKRQALAQTPVPSTIGEFTNRPQIMRNSLFWNRGDGTFAEIADFAGLAASDWSWQPTFIDVDLDGYEDLLIPAGHSRDLQDMDATMRIKALQHPWPKEMTPQIRQQTFTREMMEHARLYPTLKMPIVAFRNLGNRQFEEKTQAWGTSELGVHQGMALGDLDGDGDLDVVVNNLNGGCGIYRNDTVAPRVAVRLQGLPPNTQGIGAQVRLVGGAIPLQQQEMASGGRYLSGSEALLVFAAGSTNRIASIEVVWRNGRISKVTNVVANRLYTVDESLAKAATNSSARIVDYGSRATNQAIRIPDRAGTRAPVRPYFQDVSDRLRHVHTENIFDDFARQPLLPKRLGQSGPGVAWFDVDGDGHDDLIIGSGVGGRLAVYRGDGLKGFQRLTNALVDTAVQQDQTAIVGTHTGDGQVVVLTGVGNYEDGSTNNSSVRSHNLGTGRVEEMVPGFASSTGPLCLADLDGDGDLDLFVGGQVIPGRYPQSASSRIFRQEKGQWKLDIENSRLLEKIGLVNGAVWSDLDADGFPELVLACEWGSIRLFQNDGGNLKERASPVSLGDHPSTLKALTGWWTGVTTGDLDGDGRLDIVAGNWGLNSPYRASSEQPLRLYHGDFMGRGTMDLIETEFDPGRQVIAPRHRLDYLATALPWLQERFTTFQTFSEATIDKVLVDLRSPPEFVETRTLASMVFLNRGTSFEAEALPDEAQFAPALSTHVADFNGDGIEDVFLSQNFFALPGQEHRLDAGRGLWLQGDGTGKIRPLSAQESGVAIYGEQRGAAVGDFNEDGRVDLAVTQNGAATRLYENTRARPGLRVRLKGPPGNPLGIGAILRLQFGQRMGPAREVHAGSGYWSQDSAVQVLGGMAPPDSIHVLWPGGNKTVSKIPPSSREVTVDDQGKIQSKPDASEKR